MNRYIIDFKDTVAESDIQTYLNAIGASVVKTFNAFKNAYIVESSVEPPVTDITEHVINDDDHTVQLLGEIIQIDNTANIEHPSTAFETISTSDVNQWWKIYSLKNADLDQAAIDMPIRGAGATIYLVDSGIKKDHPEFANADIEDLFSITTDYEDRKGHGTALASVIVGGTCGITNAAIKNVKLFDTIVPTKQSDMLAAFDAIFNAYMTNQTGLGIVNCSWVIARNSYIEAKINVLIDAGLIFVCAAGNNGTAIEDVTPAAMQNVNVIGAYNSDFNPCDFSNYTGSAISVTGSATNGGKLTGWAPGQDIWSATLSGDFGNSSGTSIAAAIHSAIIASHLSVGTIDGSFNASLNVILPKTNVGFGKEGILDLSDPKYSTSPNRVSTLIIYNDSYWNEVPLQQTNFVVIQGKDFKKNVINPKTASSAEIITSLPDGLSLNNIGVISGRVSPIDSLFKVQDSVIRVTNLDGSSYDLNVKFVIKSVENIDPSQISEVDPEIAYTLTDAVSCEFGGSPGSKTDYCVDYNCMSTCQAFGSYTGFCNTETPTKTTITCVCYCY